MTAREIEGRIVEILKPHGVRSIALFGSYARGEASTASDIDVLVEFSGRKTLFDIAGIEDELSEGLGLKVDLLTEKALSPYLAEEIKKNLLVIYG